MFVGQLGIGLPVHRDEGKFGLIGVLDHSSQNANLPTLHRASTEFRFDSRKLSLDNHPPLSRSTQRNHSWKMGVCRPDGRITSLQGSIAYTG